MLKIFKAAKLHSLYDVLGMPLVIFFITIALADAFFTEKLILSEAFLPMLFFVLIYMGLVFAVPEDRRAAQRRRSRFVFIFFAVILVPMSLAHYIHPVEKFAWIADIVAAVLVSILLIYLTMTTVADLVRSSLVSLRMVVSGFCGYLMLAMAWQNIYHAMQIAGLQVFSQTTISASEPSAEVWVTNMYFSLVTISTLGYGDLAPVSNAARLVAGMEAVTGQFYIAVLIGILVGKYLQKEGSGS